MAISLRNDSQNKMSQGVKKVNRYSGVLSSKSTVVMTDPTEGVWSKGSPPAAVLLSHL